MQRVQLTTSTACISAERRIENKLRVRLAIRQALLKPPTLGFFDPKAATRLETDASRTKCFGFGLWQHHDGIWHLIQWRSRFIFETESRYALIALEMLGVAWAVRKCHTYLAGLQFHLIVVHQPLLPILNTYIQRLVLKVYHYQFTASWQCGSRHAFADAVSTAPVDNPSPCDELGEDPIHGLSVCLCLQQDERHADTALGMRYHDS